jgi:superfamily II DNA or RNA helicase
MFWMIDSLFTREPWAHQRYGVEQAIAKLSNGTKSVCLASPTGSGKTAMQIALAQWGARTGKVACLTNRILLTDQTQRVFSESKVPVGVISSSMPYLERPGCSVQIATIQTILARRRTRANYWVDADLVLADEVHQIASGESAALLNEYVERGGLLCGTTATPLGVSNVCDELIVAGQTRDLQQAGILCSALWFAPSELDTRKLVKGKVDLSLTESDARRTWGPLKGNKEVRTRIVGNILEHYGRLHPEQIHTLAFAPGVKESLWAAQFCHGRGIRALHIDGDDFWTDGQMYDRKQHKSRFEESMEAWRDGHIKIIWNRFVMREGIDEPQIKCVMLATPVGSYRSFLQMVGRGLRSHPSKDVCLVLDFGGNWWRHGSVNVNVDWESVFDCLDPDVLSKNRIAEARETGESLGRGCPHCGLIIKPEYRRVLECPHCGKRLSLGKPSRPIIQADGTLTQVTGEPIRKWRIKDKPENQSTWQGLYWHAMRKQGGEVTFNQLYDRFHYKTAVEAGTQQKPSWWKAYYPQRHLPLMPLKAKDWHRKIGEIAKEKLY